MTIHLIRSWRLRRRIRRYALTGNQEALQFARYYVDNWSQGR